jgi:hypothetical protein
MNYERLNKFIADYKNEIRRILRAERYDMIMLALKYLIDSANMDKFDNDNPVKDAPCHFSD